LSYQRAAGCRAFPEVIELSHTSNVRAAPTVAQLCSDVHKTMYSRTFDSKTSGGLNASLTRESDPRCAPPRSAWRDACCSRHSGDYSRSVRERRQGRRC
jgi:hypothetical protein